MPECSALIIRILDCVLPPSLPATHNEGETYSDFYFRNITNLNKVRACQYSFWYRPSLHTRVIFYYKNDEGNWMFKYTWGAGWHLSGGLAQYTQDVDANGIYQNVPFELYGVVVES